MFITVKQKLLLAIFVIIILSIPVGAYLLSQRQRASTPRKSLPDGTITQTPTESTSAASELKRLSTPEEEKELSPTASPAVSVSFGPTMNLKLTLEGRPQGSQSDRVFLGVAEGSPAATPKYLLTFTIDLPSSGEFNGLSLAGLTANSLYTAIIKGRAQIATSSAFVMSPSITNLNGGKSLTLLTGDLNEDNIINSADFAIAKAAFGVHSGASNWNENIDFNRDGTINSLDLGIIIKNFGKVGASGLWSSPNPAGNASATLTPASSSGTPSGTPSGGYWLWVPGI